MSEEVPDVLDVVVDHGGALKAQSPGNYGDIFRQAHWQEHLRTEDTRVSDLYPLIEQRMEGEDL